MHVDVVVELLRAQHGQVEAVEPCAQQRARIRAPGGRPGLQARQPCEVDADAGRRHLRSRPAARGCRQQRRPPRRAPRGRRTGGSTCGPQRISAAPTVRVGHASGVLSRGRLALAGLGAVVVATVGAVALLRAGVAAPSARIESDSQALTRVRVSGAGAHVVSVQRRRRARHPDPGGAARRTRLAAGAARGRPEGRRHRDHRALDARRLGARQHVPRHACAAHARRRASRAAGSRSRTGIRCCCRSPHTSLGSACAPASTGRCTRYPGSSAR